MRKAFCGTLISLVGVIYSVVLIVMATLNDVSFEDDTGLWGLIQGYGASIPFCISVLAVIIGVLLCCVGCLHKSK